MILHGNLLNSKYFKSSIIKLYNYLDTSYQKQRNTSVFDVNICLIYLCFARLEDALFYDVLTTSHPTARGYWWFTSEGILLPRIKVNVRVQITDIKNQTNLQHNARGNHRMMTNIKFLPNQ